MMPHQAGWVFALALGAFLIPSRVFGEDAPPAADVDAVASLLEFVIDADENSARDCLAILTRSIQSGELEEDRVEALRTQLGERLSAIVADEGHVLRFEAALLAASWSEPAATRIVRETFRSKSDRTDRRIAALQALAAANDQDLLQDVDRVLADSEANTAEFRGQVLPTLGQLEGSGVASVVLTHFDRFEPELQPRAIELLTQRPDWTAPLLAAIAEQRISKDALNLNQLRRIATFEDEELQRQFQAIFGTLREGRDPKREEYVREMRTFLNETPGDPERGVVAFKKLCAQCHKIHGEGAEVGPDITLNGRNNWDQLLSNVFDPSLVIGPGYQARQLVTTDGRVLTGLPVEESEQRVVLKVQGGKVETIARDEIDIYETSDVSLMPEDIEKQLTRQEIADLMSFLALDKPPSDPEAKRLSGAPAAR
jgi:putative heme-binding domain-containing protein